MADICILSTMTNSNKKVKEMQYKIFIMDPKIQFFNDNPDIFPRTLMDISENETRAVMFYLKVSYGKGIDEKVQIPTLIPIPIPKCFSLLDMRK